METAQPPVAPAASAGGNPLGVTAAPFIRSGTAAVVDLAERAERLGYDSFWVAEVTGIEAFSVLGAASRAAPGVGLGTGVLAMQVRTPPLLAMAAASLQALAPDREILLGVGVSSPVVACDWHGARYPASPLAHMREFLALLRECLSGDTVTFTGDYYQVRKFRLGVELGDRKPKIVLGALGEGMLRLAGAEADGVLLNYRGRRIALLTPVGRSGRLSRPDPTAWRQHPRARPAAALNVGRGPAYPRAYQVPAAGVRRF